MNEENSRSRKYGYETFCSVNDVTLFVLQAFDRLRYTEKEVFYFKLIYIYISVLYIL